MNPRVRRTRTDRFGYRIRPQSPDGPTQYWSTHKKGQHNKVLCCINICFEMPKRKSQIPSRQLCEDKDCKGIARFGFNENAKEIGFCSVHKLPGMEILDLEFEASMSSDISPAEVNASPQKRDKNNSAYSNCIFSGNRRSGIRSDCWYRPRQAQTCKKARAWTEKATCVYSKIKSEKLSS